MKKKYSFRRSLLGFYNLRPEKSDTIIATIPLSSLQKLVPNATEGRFCGTLKCTDAELNEVLNG